MRLDHIKKSYISEERLVIENFLYVIVSKPNKKMDIGINQPPTGFERSFVYEIPKKAIKRYKLTPQKIKLESVYEGVTEEEFNEKYRR